METENSTLTLRDSTFFDQHRCVSTEYTVLQPILLHESAALHGKLVVVVASALGHPQDLVTTCVVTQPGTRHDLQAVPVDVRVGQLGAGVQFWTVVVRVSVLTTVVVWTTVTLLICVTTLVSVDVRVVVSVVGIKTVLVVEAQVPPVAPGLVQLFPWQIVVVMLVKGPGRRIMAYDANTPRMKADIDFIMYVAWLTGAESKAIRCHDLERE
ncbi:hypothetical protein GE09DRAFT_1228808 [Coniochaeta sp. 2T2.1]|nr:hypothetical protein GE09DRAFT_1228808 [Coniochaeta sp. 2T2.1]